MTQIKPYWCQPSLQGSVHVSSPSYSYGTDCGNVRQNNEDDLWSKSPSHPFPNSPYGQLFIVADGMGGYGAGEVASAIAVEKIPQVYYHAKNEERVIEARLKKSIHTAHQTIRQQAKVHVAQKKMGTTIVAAVLQANTLTVAWAGDSRAYLLPGKHKSLQLLTRDHSKLWPQIEAGQLTWQMIQGHPDRSSLTNALNATIANLQVDTVQYPLQGGDKILLCSDGLTGEIPDSNIETILKKNEIGKALTTLIAAAKAQKRWQIKGQWVNTLGGKDNVTSIVIETKLDQQNTKQNNQRRLWQLFTLATALSYFSTIKARVPCYF